MSPPNKHVGAADWKATVFARLRWLLRPFRLSAAIALSVRGSELSLLAHASRPGDCILSRSQSEFETLAWSCPAIARRLLPADERRGPASEQL